MSKVKRVYKPNINGNHVVFRNTKGKNVSTDFYYDSSLALPKALSNTVSAKKPNVTKLELEEALWKELGQHSFSYSSCKSAIFAQRAEKLIEHYAEKITEGEAKGVITQQEQFEIMEHWCAWFGNVY